MKLFIVLMLVANVSFAQGYNYNNYNNQYRPAISTNSIDDTDRVLERQRNYMKNQINNDMRQLDINNQIRNYNYINNGSDKLNHNRYNY